MIRSRNPGAVALLLPVVVLLTQPPTRVFAFDSYPYGAPHDQITRAACTSVGWSHSATALLCASVRDPDRSEMRWAPSWLPTKWLRFLPNDSYRPFHHFDRAKGVSDHDAFVAGAAYVREQVLAAMGEVKAPVRKIPIAALGAALHALQDLHAHSNMVDLDPLAADSVEAAVWDPAAPIPVSLRLTGYDASAANPERPLGDTYSHHDFAKDAPRKNRECKSVLRGESKFAIAERLAVAASTALLRRVEASIDAPDWAALAR